MKKYLITIIMMILFSASCILEVSASGQSLVGIASGYYEKEDTASDEESDNETKEKAENKANVDTDTKDKVNIIGRFPVLNQYPELPTGCEITSLTMLLNYYDIPADKCDLADYYLDKGEVGTVNFREAFEGDPRDEYSFGCYAPVIVNTANRYLQENGYGNEYAAIDLTGMEFDDILAFLDQENPLMVWGTQDCREGHFSETWNVNGEDITWFTPEHCMVLVNYDDDYIWEADPMYGEILQYDRELFQSRYESLQKQAVALVSLQ